MNDSKRKSLSEAFVNSFGSYPIGYGIGVLVLPLSLGWLNEDPLMANIFITLTYAAVSFVRVYFFRRMFVKFGIDDNFLKLGIKLFHKVKDITIKKNYLHLKKLLITYEVVKGFTNRGQFIINNFQILKHKIP